MRIALLACLVPACQVQRCSQKFHGARRSLQHDCNHKPGKSRILRLPHFVVGVLQLGAQSRASDVLSCNLLGIEIFRKIQTRRFEVEVLVRRRS